MPRRCANPVLMQPADPRFRRAVARSPRPRARAGRRARDRRRRALYVCSPIGLGHVRRDLAIADELRALHPDLEIDWLTQQPVTRVLAERGERVHPASRWLASESAHIEIGGRRARPARLPGGPADGRDPRRQLHGLRTTSSRTSRTTCGSSTRAGTSTTSCTRTPSSSARAYAWLTDFVGWLPMPDGGAAEAALTADYNAEMRRADRAATRGCATGRCSSATRDDLVDDPARPGSADRARLGDGALRLRRLRHRRAPPVDRATLRAELGYAARRAGLPGRPSAAPASAARCCAGSSSAFPPAEERVPGLRMVRRRRPADRPRVGARARPASRSAATCPTCTGTSPPATSRSCRAG